MIFTTYFRRKKLKKKLGDVFFMKNAILKHFRRKKLEKKLAIGFYYEKLHFYAENW
jgi:hypothetical protein